MFPVTANTSISYMEGQLIFTLSENNSEKFTILVFKCDSNDNDMSLIEYGVAYLDSSKNNRKIISNYDGTGYLCEYFFSINGTVKCKKKKANCYNISLSNVESFLEYLRTVGGVVN
jgi:hypothetical protein